LGLPCKAFAGATSAAQPMPNGLCLGAARKPLSVLPGRIAAAQPIEIGIAKVELFSLSSHELLRRAELFYI